ncbi:MAG: T9SS type A sorting domain-containing protein [Bacteroidales bacterium]|nr:T9SS type A sorting domain-containing protein [Bacteroidales bacterium]
MKELIRHFILFLSGFILLSVSQAQNPGCDGERFLYPVFDSVTVVSDVIYGNNITVGGKEIDLKMDIYEPYKDTLSLRPVIFIVHGGGFTSGSKSGGRFVKLSKNYAYRGYVAVSIDYRLYDLTAPPDSFLLKDAIVRSMGDLKAAMRFMYEDAATKNAYKVDTNYFFLFGTSSGAIIANTTAYLDDINEADEQMRQLINTHGSLPGNSSNNLQFKPQSRAIMNSSGGMLDHTYIDDEDPPLVSIHCTDDPIMPFKRDWLIIMGDSVVQAYGSFYLHGRANFTGIENTLITIPGAFHLQYYWNPIYYDSMMNTSSSMFRSIICADSGGSIPVAINEAQLQSSIFIYPNPADQYVIIENIKSGEMEIYNSSGILIRKERLTNARVSVQNLKPGIYFMIVREGHNIHRHKLMIAR